MFSGCLDASVLGSAGVQKLPGRLPRSGLSIHAAKTSTWTLTREWALAQDTTVHVLCDGTYMQPQDHCLSPGQFTG